MNDVCSDLVTILSLAMLCDYHEELLIKEIGVNPTNNDCFKWGVSLWISISAPLCDLVLEPTIAGKMEKLRIYLDDPRTESLIKEHDLVYKYFIKGVDSDD